jgi:CrcB protein
VGKIPSLLRSLLVVFCGGFCGTLVRALLSLLLQSWLGNAWPYDVFLINIGGAFLLAFCIVLVESSLFPGPTHHLFINVGFLGAYTTFSSLALGDILLFSQGNWFPALLYLFGSLVGGLLAVFLGQKAGRWTVKRIWMRRKEQALLK